MGCAGATFLRETGPASAPKAQGSKDENRNESRDAMKIPGSSILGHSPFGFRNSDRMLAIAGIRQHLVRSGTGWRTYLPPGPPLFRRRIHRCFTRSRLL
jgi:hypothetical protein